MTPFVFLDLEFSGGDPNTHEICEIAAVATDVNFVSIGSFGSAVFWPEAKFSDDAYRMHAANGLLSEMSSAPHFAEVMSAFMEWMAPHRGATLAGSSVWIDRAWLERKWPAATGLFDRRLLDVSAFRVLLAATGAEHELQKIKTDHRAAADVRRDIAHVLAARKLLLAGINSQLWAEQPNGADNESRQ